MTPEERRHLSFKSDDYLNWLNTMTPIDLHFRDGTVIHTSVHEMDKHLGKRKQEKRLGKG